MQSVTVHFLNVGHGDCTIIEHASGRVSMIDINNSTTLPDEDIVALAAHKNVSVAQFKHSANFAKTWEEHYQSLLVDPIDYWESNFPNSHIFRYIQTHPDMDHMGGLAQFFYGKQVELTNFWDTKNSKTLSDSDFTSSPHNSVDWKAYDLLREGRLPDSKTVKVHHKENGDSGSYWTEDGLTILSPTPDLADYCDRTESWNNVSQVVRLDFGGRRIIFPGDAEKPAWDSIEATHDEDELSCDILKAAHHGRESGYSESAVDLMDPGLVICSVGKKPQTDASDEYKSHGAKVFSTRYAGTITAKMWEDGEVWVYNSKSEKIYSLPVLQF